MGVYNRSLQPYNLLRKFRLSNGTEWDKVAELIFWLRANRSDKFIDVNDPTTNLLYEGTVNSAQGPSSTRFEINSLDFNNAGVTVSKGRAADAAKKKALIWGGWIYLNEDPSAGSNNGFPILQELAARAFRLFVDDHNRLNVRITDVRVDASPEHATVRTVKQCVPEKEWVHFVVMIPKDCDDVDAFDNAAATMPVIFINGIRQEVQSINRVADGSGSPGSFNLKSPTAHGFRLGKGPDQSESAGDKFLDGRLADVFMYQIEGDATDAQLHSLYSATDNGAFHLGSGFLSTSPFNVLNDATLRETHPTLARSSNDGRTGKHSIHFDDSRAIHLTGSGETSFPSMLTEDNPLFNTVYQGAVNGQLSTTSAAATFGIFDEYYEENNLVSIKPFVESKIEINNSQYYQTGTQESVIPGFDQSLRNKHMVTIFGNLPATTLGNTAASHQLIGPANSTTENYTDRRSATTGSFMAYIAGDYRKNLPGRHWQEKDVTEQFRTACYGFSAPGIIGFSTGMQGGQATFDAFEADNTIDTSGTDYTTATDITLSKFQSRNIYDSFGHPIDTYQFPDGDKYEADKEFLINMSDYITEPFLVEKIVFEIPGGTVHTEIASGFKPGASLAISFISFGNAGANPHYRDNLLRLSAGDMILNTFLMHQKPTATTGSVSLFFDAQDQGLMNRTIELAVTGSTSRQLIGWGNTLFFSKFNEDGTSAALTSPAYVNANPSSAAARNDVTHPDYIGLAGLANKVGTHSVLSNWASRFSKTFSENTVQDLIINTLSGSIENIVDLGVHPQVNSSTTELSFEFTNQRIETTPKVATPQSFVGSSNLDQQIGNTAIENPFFQQPGAYDLVHEWRGGPSSILDETNPRLYTKSIVGRREAENLNITFAPGSLSTSPTRVIDLYESTGRETLYLLKPEDKLIFGMQAVINDRESGHGMKTGVDISAGEYKINLFGSFLSAGKRHSNSLAQNLATQTVSEGIGQLTVHDVHEATLQRDLASTYSDRVMSGSSNTKTQYEGYNTAPDRVTKLARRSVGLASRGDQGETGAFKLNNILTDESETLFDSLMPNFGKISQVDGFVGNKGLRQASRTTQIDIGTGATANPTWSFAFPFESRYGGITRDNAITVPFTLDRGPQYKVSYIDSGQASTSFIGLGHDGTALTGSVVVPRNSEFAFLPSNSSGIAQLINESAAIRMLFGVGGLSRGRYFFAGTQTNGRTNSNVPKASSVIDISGFKYGVANSTPVFSKAVYRRSRYGQFRDLLEPRAFNAVLINNDVGFPLTQKFFTRFGQPLSTANRNQTSCSNLSTNATSSLPFFDRDNNDEPTNRALAGQVTPVNISPNFAPGQGPFSGLR